MAPLDNSLQTSSDSVLDLPKVVIKSVGSNNFQPVNVLASSTKATPDMPQPNSSSPKALFVGIALAMVFLIAIIIIAIRNGQKSTLGTKENS